MASLTINVEFDGLGGDCQYLIDALTRDAQGSLSIPAETRDALLKLLREALESTDSFSDEFIIDLKPGPASGAGNFIATLKLGPRLSELVSAVRAIDVERCHSGSPV